MTYTHGMEHFPWQRRARAAGLTQKMLARLLGRPEMTISRQLRGQWESGVPRHVKFAIIAWELMTQDQCDQLTRALEADEDG